MNNLKTVVLGRILYRDRHLKFFSSKVELSETPKGLHSSVGNAFNGVNIK